MTDTIYDAIILGCGPAGATVGADLARRGYRVLGIDKDGFPRYHIGESLTGTVGSYLRDMGLIDVMDQRSFPIKYGVKVIGKYARNEFFVSTEPDPTWQVRRDEFDRMLLEKAISEGMEHKVATAKGVLLRDGNGLNGVRCKDENGEYQDLRSRVLVDATGQNTYLSRQGIAGRKVIDRYGDQVAVFTQIKDCYRDPGLMKDNTVVFYNEPHHWAWFIPLSDELVSVGIVVTKDSYKRVGREAVFEDTPVPRRVFEWGLRHINPDLWNRCAGREWTEPVRVIRDYSYSVFPFAGPGWICVGDSHRFIDPIFSLGVAIAVKEGRLAADAIDRALQSGDMTASFEEYQRRCSIGQEAISDTIRYFWRFPAFFGIQARGKYRDDIIKLFAGDCYDDEPLPGLVMMRESLAKNPEGLTNPATS